jgi:hypothetical protein
MEIVKTQYRIITQDLPHTVNNRYLQFKSSTIIKHWFRKDEIIEEWKFIPREYIIYVEEEFCTIESCPSHLAFLEKDLFIGCTIGQENLGRFGLTWFVEKYSNIEEYFKEMNIKRKEYLLDQKKKKEVIYL